MTRTIEEALEKNLTGFHIGNRLILPFHCQLLKLIVSKEIFHEFVGSEHIKISQDPNNTSIYFRIIGKLSNYVGSYQLVKIIVAEIGADLCDPTSHIKLFCQIEESHVVKITIPNDDILFIE
jgi:hypothetical protein